MPATIDPAAEACQALIAKINAGSAYTLASGATYSEELIDQLESINALRVDIVAGDVQTLQETLDSEGRANVPIRIMFRQRVATTDQHAIDALKLLVRQVFQQIQNFRTSRVCVWDCDIDAKQSPDKKILQQNGVFVAAILLRVEVEASP